MLKNTHWVSFADLTPEEVTAVSGQRHEPSWLLQYRLAALALLSEHHVQPYWPGPGGFQKPPAASAVARYFTHPDEADLVYQRLAQSLHTQGIIYGDFFDVLRDHPDLIQKVLGSIIRPEENALAALNALLFTGGMVLYVPPGVTCTVPLSYFRSLANPGQVEHHLIWLDQDAHADFVEGRPSLDYAPSHLVESEVRLSSHASLRYIAIKNWGASVSTWVNKRVHCGQNSRLTWIEGHFGGRATSESTQVFLDGDGAHARLVTCAVAQEGQRTHYAPQIFHRGSETHSELVARFLSNGGEVGIQGGTHVLLGSKNTRISRDVVSIGPLSSIPVEDQSMMLEKPETLAGPLWTASAPYEWAASAHTTSEAAAALAQPFLTELPMEFAIEAQRLIRQKSQD
jgi:Fe-S cluster assembly protein SufB